VEHAQVAKILNTLAAHMAEPDTFNHTILVNTETNGGYYRLTGRKVIVHPDRIASGVLLDIIVRDLFAMVESKDSAAQRLRDKDIKVYKKAAKEAIDYLWSHLSPEEFESWLYDLLA